MPIPAILVIAFQVAAGQTLDIQGHRGARGLLPENSTAGFLYAVDLGVSTLEIDVVVAGDSTVVVSHEPWMLETICSDPDGRAITDGQSHNIFRMSYEDVAHYDCGKRGHPGFPRQKRQAAVKPRLSDVIHAVESHAAERGMDPLRYNIEIKSREEWDSIYTPPPAIFAQLVHEVVARAGIMDRTTIQSFDFRSLQAAHGIGAAWQLAVLVRSDRDLPAVLDRLGFTPQVFSPSFQIVDESLVLAAHNLEMRIIPWTVNEVSDMKRIMAMGVDGLITDYPDLALTLFRRVVRVAAGSRAWAVSGSNGGLCRPRIVQRRSTVLSPLFLLLGLDCQAEEGSQLLLLFGAKRQPGRFGALVEVQLPAHCKRPLKPILIR